MNGVRKSCLAVFLMVTLASRSSAEVVTFDEPLAKSSWAQIFVERNVGPFDHLQMYMLPTDSWELPTAIYPFSPTWSQTWNDGTYLVADGNDLTKLYFALQFHGVRSDPLTFLFQAWDDDIVRETANATWTGSEWVTTPGTWDTPRITPEPATIALLALGVLLFARRSR